MNLKDVIYTHFKAGLLTLATLNALCEPSLKLRELGTMSGCVTSFLTNVGFWITQDELYVATVWALL